MGTEPEEQGDLLLFAVAVCLNDHSRLPESTVSIHMEVVYARSSEEALGKVVHKLDAKKGLVGAWATRSIVLPKVVVEVQGGIAEVTNCPAAVQVEIIDHDNEKHA